MTSANGSSLAARSARFNDTTGAISWNYQSAALHPDCCVCQLGPDQYPGTPHKHYDDPPHACARCMCASYRPIRLLVESIGEALGHMFKEQSCGVASHADHCDCWMAPR